MRSQSSLATPLGPDSLTWRHFGDWRGILQGPWAGSMQNMHPKLGAAVEQHSLFFTERWQRLYRSLYPIAGAVYDGDRAGQTAAEIRGYHRDIKGVDSQGRRYHALDPDVFYWAHATFFMGTILTAEHFGDGLTEAEKRQLFDEHVEWYRQYGVSMRPVPESWEDFQAYWDHMCRNVLEDNKATRDVLNIAGIAKPPFAPFGLVPTFVWNIVRIPMGLFMVWLTVGLYDQPVRDLLGYRWTALDARLHRLVGRAVNVAFRLVPSRFRMHPRARAGWDRAEGRIPSDAPLVETPDRYLPPVSEWDSPIHYNPRRGQCPVSRRTA